MLYCVVYGTIIRIILGLEIHVKMPNHPCFIFVIGKPLCHTNCQTSEKLSAKFNSLFTNGHFDQFNRCKFFYISSSQSRFKAIMRAVSGSSTILQNFTILSMPEEAITHTASYVLTRSRASMEAYDPISVHQNQIQPQPRIFSFSWYHKSMFAVMFFMMLCMWFFRDSVGESL